jgi:hypothetical protein
MKTIATKNLPKIIRLVMPLTILLLVAGCGQSESSKKTAVLNTNPATESTTASNSSQETTGNQNCPQQFDFGIPKSAGVPREVVGLPLGASLEPVLNFFKCYQEGSIINIEPKFADVDTNNTATRGLIEAYYGFRKKTTQEMFDDAETERRNPQGSASQIAIRSLSQRVGGPDTYKQIAPTAEYFAIGAVGMLGQEKVVQVERTQSFQEGSRPAVSDLTTALNQKYGQSQGEDKTSRYTKLIWSLDQSGQVLAKADPRLLECSSVEESCKSTCGLTIVALIYNSEQDAALAEQVVVKMTDQAATINAIEAFKQQLASAQSEKTKAEIEQTRQSGTPKF